LTGLFLIWIAIGGTLRLVAPCTTFLPHGRLSERKLSPGVFE
jgi:hypothetical protein